MSSPFRKAKEYNALNVFGDGRKRNKSKKMYQGKLRGTTKTKTARCIVKVLKDLESIDETTIQVDDSKYRGKHVARSVGP